MQLCLLWIELPKTIAYLKWRSPTIRVTTRAGACSSSHIDQCSSTMDYAADKGFPHVTEKLSRTNRLAMPRDRSIF
jgi:hypothetical protein